MAVAETCGVVVRGSSLKSKKEPEQSVAISL